MKKRILIYLVLLCICFIPKVYAGEFNYLKITTVFDGSGIPINLEKIHLYYSTITDGVEKNESIVLTRTYNFNNKIPVLSIDDVKFRYAVAITKNNVVDVYGFVTFKGNVEQDINNQTIDLTVIGKLNNRGFDGNKYRGNSDLDNEDINKITSSTNVENTTIVTKTNSSGEVISSEVITNTTTTSTSTVSKPTGTQYIHDSKTKTDEEKKEELKQSGFTLLIVVLIILGIAAIAGVITVVKMAKANRSV